MRVKKDRVYFMRSIATALVTLIAVTYAIPTQAGALDDIINPPTGPITEKPQIGITPPTGPVTEKPQIGGPLDSAKSVFSLPPEQQVQGPNFFIEIFCKPGANPGAIREADCKEQPNSTLGQSK